MCVIPVKTGCPARGCRFRQEIGEDFDDIFRPENIRTAVHQGKDIGDLDDERILAERGCFLRRMMIADGGYQLFRQQPFFGKLQSHLVMADGKTFFLLGGIVEIAVVGQAPAGSDTDRGNVMNIASLPMSWMRPAINSSLGERWRCSPMILAARPQVKACSQKRRTVCLVSLFILGNACKNRLADHDISDLLIAEDDHGPFNGADFSRNPEKCRVGDF